MGLWLDLSRLVVVANLALLLSIGSVWLRNYRRHGARHTLGLLVVAAFLLVENALWLFLYTLHPGFVGWFVRAGADVQVGVMSLCGLELVALVVLAKLTWL